jgi:hypothetical protein
MTNKSYSGISDAELAPGQPITTSLMTRMRDDALAITQNDPIAAVFAGLAGNWVQRWQRINATNPPPSPTSGTWVVPDGVHRICVIIVGAGGSGSNALGASTAGTGGITSVGPYGGVNPRAEGGWGNNSGNRVTEFYECLIGFRGHKAGREGTDGSDTVFGPGGESGDAATSLGAGGGGGTAGGGAGAVGFAIINCSPGDSIPYEVGQSYDASILAGGNFGGPGCILIGS